MSALLLTALFVFSATFAAATVLGTWRSTAKAILALRHELRGCAETRDVRYSLRTLEVRSLGARIYRPDFKASHRPLREDIRAAA